MDMDLTPAGISQLAVGFRGTKPLFSVAELGVFTALAQGPLDDESLRQRHQLHPRGARDLFDALVLTSPREYAYE